jgi:hypothetical protein
MVGDGVFEFHYFQHWSWPHQTTPGIGISSNFDVLLTSDILDKEGKCPATTY